MDPKFKAKFVTALESGKYKQGTVELRNPEDHYCALGVACDVVDPEGWKKVGDFWGWHGEDPFFASDLVKDEYLTVTERGKLLSLNDGQGKSFREIAQWVRDNC